MQVTAMAPKLARGGLGPVKKKPTKKIKAKAKGKK